MSWAWAHRYVRHRQRNLEDPNVLRPSCQYGLRTARPGFSRAVKRIEALASDASPFVASCRRGRPRDPDVAEALARAATSVG